MRGRLTEQLQLDTSQRVTIREFRQQIPFDLIGILSMAGAITWMTVSFAPHVSSDRLLTFAGLIAFLLMLWIASFRSRTTHRLSESDYLDLAQFRSIAMAVAINAAIAVSVWILLPAAPPELVDAQIVFYVWYMLTFALVANEAVGKARHALWMVTGSLTFYLMLHPPHGGRVIALVILTMGISTSLAQQMVRRSAVRAMTAYEEAEVAKQRLQVAVVEVSAQRDARARFMASVSHDLQQPLLAAQMLFDLACDPNDPKARALAADGRAAFSSVRGLLEQMLDFMRLTAGVGSIALVDCSVDEGLTALRTRYAHRDLGSAEMKWVSSSLSIAVNLDHFHRVLGNLIENAISHSGARRILIGATRSADCVRIHVIDDGCGVPTELRATLFEPYVRGIPKVGAAPGFGLGLASSATLAEALGGTLALVPTSKRGSHFVVELPRTKRTKPALLESKESQLCTAV